MLDFTLFSVAKFDNDLLFSLGLILGCIWSVDQSLIFWWLWINGLFGRIYRLAIPFWVCEVVICINEIIDRKIVFSIKCTSSTTNDLFEFDHRIHRTKQDNISDIASIHTCRELL